MGFVKVSTYIFCYLLHLGFEDSEVLVTIYFLGETFRMRFGCFLDSLTCFIIEVHEAEKLLICVVFYHLGFAMPRQFYRRQAQQASQGMEPRRT